MAGAILPFATVSDGLRLKVRLAPKASRERIIGIGADADGGVAIKIAVTAAPEAGKANDALLALLARQLGVAKRDLTLTRGASDRRKLVHVAGDPLVLARRVEEMLRPWSQG